MFYLDQDYLDELRAERQDRYNDAIYSCDRDAEEEDSDDE